MSYDREKLSHLVGMRVREYRTQRNMSQEELAFISGIHPDFLGKMERGERCPSVDTLNKVCDGLNISMSQLLDFNTNIEPSIAEAMYRIEKSLSEMSANQAMALAEIVEHIAYMNKQK